MTYAAQLPAADAGRLDDNIALMKDAGASWARTGVAERIGILQEIKRALFDVADDWATSASRHKEIPQGSPLEGEEWISGPYAVMKACNGLIATLSQMEGKTFLSGLKTRELGTGHLAVNVIPSSIWDRLLLSGISAEVWMQEGVTRANLAENTASAYDVPAGAREGRVALVLGAGNIAAIPPLDCFHKLFTENQTVILKMNPVNDYLAEFLERALKPLIARDALRIVKGGADVGAYLCKHPDIDEIHITGAAASHDAIVWGTGDEARANRKAGTPVNDRRITSELGAVCPTIVVPGPWSKADIRFQAEHIVTQKLQNSGFNCIACQMLVLPADWDRTGLLVEQVEAVIRAGYPRGAYYPGAAQRVADFTSGREDAALIDRGDAPACAIVPFRAGTDTRLATSEVFAPAMSTYEIAGSDAETYLRDAVKFANSELYGTLGANILIHPKTLRQIGRATFEAILADLKYGTIAVNSWAGVGFSLGQCTWGAFPGHSLKDVQSGIGTVHNTFMFDKPERTVITQPFRPFPRSVLNGEMTLLPKPPWFVTNRRQKIVGKLLTAFEYAPGWSRLPKIVFNALRG